VGGKYLVRLKVVGPSEGNFGERTRLITEKSRLRPRITPWEVEGI